MGDDQKLTFFAFFFKFFAVWSRCRLAGISHAHILFSSLIEGHAELLNVFFCGSVPRTESSRDECFDVSFSEMAAFSNADAIFA